MLVKVCLLVAICVQAAVCDSDASSSSSSGAGKSCDFTTNHKIAYTGDMQKDFIAFMTQYYPSYNPSTDTKYQSRYKKFVNHYKKLMSHDCGKESYDVGLNKFSFWSDDMLNRRINNRIGELTAQRIAENQGAIIRSKPSRQLPSSFSWVDQGKVASVKDQGQCGCCYAFSAAAVIESVYAITCNTAPPELSPQQYVDCSYGVGVKSGSTTRTSCKNSVCTKTVTNYTLYYNNVSWGNGGCDGGVSSYCWAYNMNTSNSQEYLGNYPFVSGITLNEQACQYSSSGAVGFKVTNYSYVAFGDEVAMQNALVQYGPLSCAMDASTLSPYAGGVLTSTSGCSSTSTNHAITIVGYGTLNNVPYWLIKNSWGSSWGLNGYFMLYRGSNTCGIATSCAYASVSCS